jgi:chorismate synthase
LPNPPTSNRQPLIRKGISNGATINFNVAFKPVSSIKKNQSTIDINHNQVDLQINGRHDVCVVPRAVPIVEAMAAIVIMDFMLRQKIYA